MIKSLTPQKCSKLSNLLNNTSLIVYLEQLNHISERLCRTGLKIQVSFSLKPVLAVWEPALPPMVVPNPRKLLPHKREKQLKMIILRKFCVEESPNNLHSKVKIAKRERMAIIIDREVICRAWCSCQMVDSWLWTMICINKPLKSRLFLT